MAEAKAVVLSIVICHHTGRLIDICLESIAKSVPETPTYEIILIPSAAFCPHTAYPNVRMICSAEGPAEKRNIGARLAKGRYLVFLDDDVELTPDCLLRLVEFMRAFPQVAMSYAKILKMDDRVTFDDCGSWLTWTGFLWARAQNGVKDVGQYDYPCRILSSKSATCIVRADAFHEVGGFDKDYFILGEETDLSWRLWLRGWEVWYTPHAVSYHAFDTPLKPKDKYYTLSRIHFYGSRNYLWMLMTNLGTLRLIRTIPLQIGAWCVSAGGFLVQGQGRRAWLILTGICSCLKPMNLFRLLSKRRLVQSTRMVSDRELMKKVMRNPSFSYYLKRLLRYQRQGLHGAILLGIILAKRPTMK